MDKNEEDKLKKIGLEKEIKDELIVWAKKKTYFLTILITVIATLGIYTVFTNVVNWAVEDDLNMAKNTAFESKIMMNNANKTLERLRELELEAIKDLEELKIKRYEMAVSLEELKEKIAIVDANTERLFADQEILIKENDLKKGNLESNTNFSETTILVFYQPIRNNEDSAKEILNELLKKGYRSSSTSTDFSELRKKHPVGTIYVNYKNSEFESRQEIEQVFDDLNITNYVISDNPYPLKSGDVQIMIF